MDCNSVVWGLVSIKHKALKLFPRTRAGCRRRGRERVRKQKRGRRERGKKRKTKKRGGVSDTMTNNNMTQKSPCPHLCPAYCSGVKDVSKPHSNFTKVPGFCT